MSSRSGHGHSHKHTSKSKHSGTSKHHQKHQPGRHHSKQSPYAGGPLTATVKGQHAKHSKARGLALGEAVPCCAAEALAASLRLAGWPVGDEDVLALHQAAGGTAARPVSIMAALEAASAFGLAGVRPRWYDFHSWDTAGSTEGDVLRIDELNVAAFAVEAGTFPPVLREPELHRPMRQAVDRGHSIILGAELPGAHALTLDGPGVWSWGEWHPWTCFPGAVLEEAWRVMWP